MDTTDISPSVRLSIHTYAQITPGKRSPTVSTLEEDNWVAVQALVRLH